MSTLLPVTSHSATQRAPCCAVRSLPEQGRDVTAPALTSQKEQTHLLRMKRGEGKGKRAVPVGGLLPAAAPRRSVQEAVQPRLAAAAGHGGSCRPRPGAVLLPAPHRTGPEGCGVRLRGKGSRTAHSEALGTGGGGICSRLARATAQGASPGGATPKHLGNALVKVLQQQQTQPWLGCKVPARKEDARSMLTELQGYTNQRPQSMWV